MFSKERTIICCWSLRIHFFCDNAEALGQIVDLRIICRKSPGREEKLSSWLQNLGGCAHLFFKASALWADAFYKSKCPSVCLSVLLFVRLCVRSLFRYRLNFFWPPLPEVGCPIFLEIRNHWGKVMERSGLRFEHFCLKIVKNRRTKKKFF